MTTSGDSVTQQANTTAQFVRAGSEATALFTASALGQQATVDQLLAADPLLVHQRAPDGKTPLHIAAQWGQLEIAQVLLKHGADANTADHEGRTPLHAMTGSATRLDLLDLLITHGADPNHADQAGNAPLFLAASLIHHPGHDWGAHDWLAEALLKHGARLDAFTAVILNREAELRGLLTAEPALINARKRNGYIPNGSTLLHFAADRGHTAVTAALLEYGADVTAIDARGRPPLYLAGHNAGARKPGPTPEVVALLLTAGAPLDVFSAALLGDMNALQQLVTAGPHLAHAVDAGGNTPLHLAAWNGQTEATRWLLERGAQPNPANRRGETPLGLAANYHHADVVGLLLAHGALCPLFTAIGLARPDLVSAALELDPALATAINRYNRTAVQMASEGAMWSYTFDNLEAVEKQKENLRLLHARGAPPEVWSAIVLDQAEVLERLLIEQPNLVNVADNGNTPLHLAANLGRAAHAEMLIAHGAALEVRDFAGATPLRRAVGFIPGVGHGDAETAEVLLKHGARLDARNNWSDTPFGVSLATPAVAEVLLRHGATLDVWAAAALDRREALTAFLAADPQQLNAPGPFGFVPLTWAVVNGHAALVSALLNQGASLEIRPWGRSLLTWANLCRQPTVAALLRDLGLTE